MKNPFKVNPLKSKIAWSFAIVYPFLDELFSDPRNIPFFPEWGLRYLLSKIGICWELLCPSPISPYGFFIFNIVIGFIFGYFAYVLIGSREMFIKKHYIHHGSSRQMSYKQQNSGQSQLDKKFRKDKLNEKESK